MRADPQASAGQAGFVAALCDPRADAPSDLRTWNGSDPRQRFGVYRNNVAVSLDRALSDLFPVCARAVGAEFFAMLAWHYRQERPPRSRQLWRYGEGFGDFLAKFPAAANLPWLPDLARLETLRTSAYHSADADALAPAALARVQPEAWDQVRLTAHPAMRLLASPCSVISIWGFHQREDLPATMIWDEPEAGLVTRPRHDVEVRLLPPGAFAFLSALAVGRNALEAAEAGAAAAPGFDLVETLRLTLEAGAFQSTIPEL